MPTAARPLSAVLLLAALVLAGCGLFDKEPAILNGVVLSSASNQPIGDAVVQLSVLGTNRVAQELRTDPDGTFSFTVDVDSVETFRVTAFKPAEYETSDLTITVEAEQVLTLPTLRLAPSIGDTRPATISGFVLDDRDGSGLSGATIRVEDVARNRVLRQGSTDGEGYYEISLSLASDTELRVSAQREGFETNFVDATIAASEVNALGDIRLRSAGPAQLSGTVVDDATQLPIAEAQVQVRDVARQLILQELQTNAAGQFQTTLQLAQATEIEVRVSRSGYGSAAQTVTLDRGGSAVLPDFRLAAETVEARSITLQNRTAQSIGVNGSGTVETSKLTFVVLDGTGTPVGSASSVDVRFRMLNHPSPPGSPESEFIYPAQATTNAEGLVDVTLTSGIRSGVVQVQAEFDGPDGLVRSQPVLITIHGGLPNQAHFTIAPLKRNFHGRTVVGIENTISVIAGDQYANPVQPQTAIYFTTSHGVVEASANTDAQGRATAQLIAGQPLPDIDGLATITARTAGVNGAEVTGSTTVLFSGPTQVELQYVSGSIAQGGTVQYRFFVRDDLGNPLEGGSSASVSVQGENVEAIGQTNVTIPDALSGGSGRTEFTFSVRSTAEQEEDEDGNVEWQPASIDTITIQVTSPNGSGAFQCYGTTCPGTQNRGTVRMQRDERL